jgi:hypothetical protein
MDAYVAFKRYFDLAKVADNTTWRTVYMLGLMCAMAVNHGTLVSFIGEEGLGADWPDPRHAGNGIPDDGSRPYL